MDVTNLRDRTALVTGAGSGIGRASALAFARRGANLAICDVDEGGLAETEAEARKLGVEVLSRRVDVASAEQMQAFADAVHARVAAIDVLMNNAGVGLGGGLLETSLEDWHWIVDINLFGVVHGIHHFVPAMVRRGRGGHVVNVASMAGYVAGSMLPAYTTTKFAVIGLSESLREELAPHRIGVTAVCPGIINTGIVQASRLRGTQASEANRAEMQRGFARRNYTPERVAENVLRAIQRNRAVAPISPEAWVFYYAKRLAPGAVRWLGAQLTSRQAAAAKRGSG
jgi:NAD(P)-dependent dehydrogenase (short-subunit alcohol dehydrogenase family)